MPEMPAPMTAMRMGRVYASIAPFADAATIQSMSTSDVPRIARMRAARDYTRMALTLLVGVTVITLATSPEREPPANTEVEVEPEPERRSAVRVRPSDVGQRSIVEDVALDRWHAHL